MQTRTKKAREKTKLTLKFEFDNLVLRDKSAFKLKKKYKEIKKEKIKVTNSNVFYKRRFIIEKNIKKLVIKKAKIANSKYFQNAKRDNCTIQYIFRNTCAKISAISKATIN